MPRGGFPDFIIIGAQKCATSSLHVMLGKHPEISVSSVKETNFFLGGREEGWYRSLFDPERRLWGESSPDYAMRHRHPGVPARIASMVPDARLVYIVRDPVDRIVSHWIHRVAHGTERRPFPAAIREGGYADGSRYAYQLRPFVERFARDRILILDQAELASDPTALWARLLAFLGASDDVPVPVRHVHASAAKRRPSRLDALVPDLRSRRSRWLHKLPTPLTRRDEIGRPTPTDDDLAVLREQLADDVAAFRQLSGMAFDTWKV